MTTPKITDKAILIGFDPKGMCIYSEMIDLSDYYDGEHVWDRAESVKKLKLEKVRGMLFDSDGILEQEFESVFDLKTGIYKSGYTRYADGTVRKD